MQFSNVAASFLKQEIMNTIQSNENWWKYNKKVVITFYNCC